VIPLRDANPTRRTPVVTIALIALCVVAFAYELGRQATGGEAGFERFLADWALNPVHLTAALGGEGSEGLTHQVATVFSSMFLHAGWIHLIGNMLYLWIFGNNVEDRFGRLRFLAFYLLGGVAAAAGQVAIDPSFDGPVIGASGAIAAVLGAYLVLYPGARVLTVVFLGFFFQLLQVPAVILLGFWFVLQLLSGVASLGPEAAATQVAFFAHIGGFVFGLVVGLIVRAVGGAGSVGRFGSPGGSRVG
jgi:membrane associated rhomboid family serine protease